MKKLIYAAMLVLMLPMMVWAQNAVKVNEGTPIVWADTTDYTGTVSGLSRTHQIDLTSVASGAARQGAKADLGDLRDVAYRVAIAVEFASAAASNETVDIYFGCSPSTTAGNANPGGLSGADAAYTGTAGDSLADSLQQLTFVGALVTTSDNTTVVQYGEVGLFSSSLRYCMPVLVNNSTGALVADAVEMYIALVPLTLEIQP